MGIVLTNDTIVSKVLNNNIILVRDKSVEKILFCRGIGFNKKFGQILEAGLEVDKIFTIENEQNQENLKGVINRIDKSFIGLCEEAIREVSDKLGEELNESIHISLIDHLALAIRRIKKGEDIENPFIVEIETLYAKEFELSKIFAEKIYDAYKVSFPDGELGFITLHIHSARNSGKLSNTIKYSYLRNTVIEYIEDCLNIEIDKKSLDYARFVTHIRFAIERILTDKRLKNDLVGVIRNVYPLAYKIAQEVSKFIEEELEKEVTEDEVAYLAMHIERFRVSIET